MDLSEYLKMQYNNLKAGSINAIKDRNKVLQNDRKKKRETLLAVNRRIDANMSPYTSPAPRKLLNNVRLIEKTIIPFPTIEEKPTTINNEEERKNKRLAMLAKWKSEKAKLKLAEKAKQKPLFKVCHVEKELRQFAPANHTFKAPAGIKPINLKVMNASSTNTPCRAGSSSTNNFKIQRMGSCNTSKGMTTRSMSKITSKTCQIEDTEKITAKNNKTTNPLTKKQTSIKNVRKLGGIPKISSTTTNKEPKSKAKIENKKTSNKIQVETVNDFKIRSIPIVVVTNTEVKKDQISTPAVKKNPRKKSANNTIKLENKNDTTSDHGKCSPESVISNTLMKKEPITTPASKKGLGKKSANNAIKLENKKDTTDHGKASAVISNTQVEKMHISIPGAKNGCGKKSANKIEVKNYATEHLEAPQLIITCTEEEKNKISTPTTKGSLRKSSVNSATNSESRIPISRTSLIATPNRRVNLENSSEIPVVPKTPEMPSSTCYLSPFVTLSRGKTNARNEYRARLSIDNNNLNLINVSPELQEAISAQSSPQVAAQHFECKLNLEIKRIMDIYSKWEEYLEDPDLPEEATCSINVAIGQSKLLISKKFGQFRKLIQQCKLQDFEEKAITSTDLHGFWDMIFIQVEDVDKRFTNLERLKANNWEELLPQQNHQQNHVQKIKKNNKPKKKTTASSRLKDLIKEARLQKRNKVNVRGDDALLDGEFSKTPINKKEVVEPILTTSNNKVRRISEIKSDTKKRCSSSPGLTILKVTQSIKQGNGLTPAKSILKTDRRGFSTGKKSVAFRENLNLTISPTILFPDNNINEEDGINNIKPKVRKSLTFGEKNKENSPRIIRKSKRLTNCV